MKLYKEEEVQAVCSPKLAFDAVRKAHLDYGQGWVDNVVRSRARLSTMSLHTMSASSEALKRAAVKLYSATREGVRAQVLLYDAITGQQLATIEANTLGMRRTAAASLLAACWMLGIEGEGAKSINIGLVGTGFQARGVLEAFIDAESGFLPGAVKVYSRNEENREAFSAQLKSNWTISPSDSLRELCVGSEIILTATTSSAPVITPELPLDSIRFISALGSNSLARVEIHPRVVTGARKIVVDLKDVAVKEAGDLLKPLENGKLLWSSVKELHELAPTAPLKQHTGAKGYSLFCSQGAAMQDLYLASSLYDVLNS